MTTADVTAPWAEVRSRMLAYVGRRVRDRSAAEDIVQDVFVRVAANPAAWSAVRDPAAYLLHLTKHAVADYYRRPGREVPVTIDTLNRPAAMADDATDTHQIAACLIPLMKGLSPRDQEALRLVDIDGTTQASAAKELGLSISGVKSRVQRARARLRDQLLACCTFEVDHRGSPTLFAESSTCSTQC